MYQKPNEWSTDAEMLKNAELENKGQQGNGARSLEIIIAKKCEINSNVKSSLENPGYFP